MRHIVAVDVGVAYVPHTDSRPLVLAAKEAVHVVVCKKRELVWFGLVYLEVHVKALKFLHQRKACSDFLSPESLHDRDPQSWLDGSLRLRPLSWEMTLMQ